MRILLINPITNPKIVKVRVSIGIASISAAAKAKGHETTLLCPWDFEPVEITKKMIDYKPDLVAISSVSGQFELTKKIISWLHMHFKVPIVLGGIHATVAPEDAIETPGIIGICIGEGDTAFVELISKLEKGEDYYHIPNFWFKDSEGNIIKNPPRGVIKNLDELAFPDRSIFEPYLDNEDQIVEFMFSRGCIFQCRYCINHVMHKIYGIAGYLRVRSVDNCLQEIKSVVTKYKETHNGQVPKRLEFHDDTFMLHRKWFNEFCEKYAAEIGLPFACNGRVETMDEEVVLLLKKANCVEVKIGLESGNEKIRKEVLNRQMSNEQIIKVFDLCNKHGLTTSSFNMIGVPGETEETIMDTILLNRRIKPTVAGVSIFYPFKGTELYKTCLDNGYISERKTISFYEGKSVLNLPTISHEKIEYYFRLFQTGIYHPKLVPIVSFAIKMKLYDPIKSTYLFFRKMGSKMLSRRQIDFIRMVLRHGK